jgi:hypothetical protein
MTDGDLGSLLLGSTALGLGPTIVDNTPKLKVQNESPILKVEVE